MVPSRKRERTLSSFASCAGVRRTDTYALSGEQRKAIDAITASTGARSFYVHGVTGSGKTEVFLRAAEAVLARGKSVIYLVPEIALTHQVLQEVYVRFGSQAAVLHSALSGSQRLGEWRRIQRMRHCVVIGARSAIFAPLKRLGLVIMDEEHDSSYKSAHVPRYHARQVAMYRCADANCPFVMGSATPSVEAWYAMLRGAVRRLPLTARVAGGAPPRVEVVDVSKEALLLSTRLVDEIRKTKEAGYQSMLFLNRRGFSYSFQCRSCGYTLCCTQCAVPLTWHKRVGAMQCHYCGRQEAPPESCPCCHSFDTRYGGVGTEYIEEAVQALFPEYRIARVDTDALRSGHVQQTMEQFRAGKIDVLLGTQMIAKGFNFPTLRLVGIACADTGLHTPDFRAAERSFALMMQVAGRAGRYVDNGLVIIQTRNPAHPAVVCAQHGDCESFYAQELAQREALCFPPFVRLIRFVFRSKTRRKAKDAAYAAHALLTAQMPLGADVLGPAACVVAQVAGSYRMQILLRAPSFPVVQQVARSFLDEFRAPAGVYVESDVDPVNVL